MQSLEAVRGAVKELHAPGLTDGRRSEVQSFLLRVIGQPDTAVLALSVLHPSNADNDPQLGLFCAGALENLARKGFHGVNSANRWQIHETLLAAVASNKYPQFLTSKLCDVAVQYGKRELVVEGAPGTDFLQEATDMSASDDPSIRRTGLQILCAAVEDSMDTLRHDLLSRYRARYRQIFRARAAQVCAAMLPGLKLDDDFIASNCVECLQSMMRDVRPNMFIIEALQDTSFARTGDDISSVALLALMDAYRSRALNAEELSRAMEHLYSVLTARGVDSAAFLSSALAMAEVLLEKGVLRSATDPTCRAGLTASLTALMEVTNRVEQPELFSAALRCWLAVAVQLNEARTSGHGGDGVASAQAAAEQLRDGLLTLAQHVMNKVQFGSNGRVLEALEHWSDGEEDDHGVAGDGADPDAADRDAQEPGPRGAGSPRSEYIRICLEVINELGRLYPTEVRPALVGFSLQMLGDPARDLRDKRMALQLIADAAAEAPADAGTAALVESVMGSCLGGPAPLRAAAFRTITSMVDALGARPDLARSVGASAVGECLSAVSGPDDAAATRVAAAELFSELTRRVRAPIFEAAPVRGGDLLALPSDRVAALLARGAMHFWLMPPRSSASATTSLSDDEWARRSAAFRQFVVEALPGYAALCSGAPAGTADALHRAVRRGTAVLGAVLPEVRGELSGTRDALWVGCGDLIRASMSVLEAVLAPPSDPANVSLLLRMLSGAFAVFPRFVGDLPVEVIDRSLRHVGQLAPGEARERTLRAFLHLLKSRLAEITPGGADSVLEPVLGLCVECITRGADPDQLVVALDTIDEALSRHWRFFFPVELAAVASGAAAPPPPQEHRTKAFALALQGIAHSLSSPVPQVVDGALAVLEKVNRTRHLLSRRALWETDVGVLTASRITELFLQRTHASLDDRVKALLFDLAAGAPDAFYGATLPRVLGSMPHLTAAEQAELCRDLARPGDEPTFSSAADRLANDAACLQEMKQVRV